MPRSSEPRSEVFNTKKRPGALPVTTGGVSSATKLRFGCVEEPISIPIYAPEISVPNPVTLAPEIRGRTTQNLVSSAKNSSVLGVICAVAITRW